MIARTNRCDYLGAAPPPRVGAPSDKSFTECFGPTSIGRCDMTAGSRFPSDGSGESDDPIAAVRRALEEAYERLQSSNETLASANDELRTTIAELETTNRELET